MLLQREPENICVKHVVALVKPDGHTILAILFILAAIVSPFLQRCFVEVTGERINRGAWYGLEVVCVYRLYGLESYMEHAKGKRRKL